MPGTYTKLYVHVVFSTKNRHPYLKPKVAERLYPYIGGIAHNIGFDLILANGVEDHVHLILKIPPRLSLSEITKLIKSNSSKWIHETFPDIQDFSWQSGYSAFSVSQSKLQTVYQYVQKQKEHHAKTSFKDELFDLLRRHKIEFDESE